jgi:hypothetical protein
VSLREAEEEEADCMPFEHSESPHTYYDHCSLTATFLEAGCPTQAILLQQRACEELARIFGPMDQDVLAYNLRSQRARRDIGRITQVIYMPTLTRR